MSKAKVLLVLLAWASLGCLGHAAEFHAEGVTEGATVLWFLGTEITIEVYGESSFAMTLTVDGEPVNLFTEGTTFGWGIGDSRSLETTMWILFDSVGTTTDGAPVAARGGLRMVGDEVDFDALSLGAGSGMFILILEVGEDSHVVTGSLTATATGQFVPPDQPGTMQVDGGGTFVLAGHPSVLPEDLASALPWSPEEWPDDHRAQLLALLEGIAYDEPASVEDTP